jgi:hypothetical protein
MNERLAREYPGQALQLAVIDAPLAKQLGKVFSAQNLERWVDWDWEELFHKRVKREKSSWMFAVVVAGSYGAVCYGTISIDNDCVSLEYLERKLDVVALKGIAAEIAIQYAEALAGYLELGEIRVCDPDPALVEFYEQNFSLTRQSVGNEVTYLFKKVQS